MVQNVMSICLFALFVIIVQIRAAVMRKRGIHVIVFGQTDKSDFILVPLVLAIAYTALARTFGLPIWDVLIHPFWENDTPGWFGLGLSVVAIIGFILTLVSFGDSFRVGIDENKPDKLITSGMFAISRKPDLRLLFNVFHWLILSSSQYRNSRSNRFICTCHTSADITGRKIPCRALR